MREFMANIVLSSGLGIALFLLLTWEWMKKNALPILLGVGATTICLFLYIVNNQLNFRFQSFFGLLALIALAAMFSKNLRNVHWRTIIVGIGLQVLLATCILRIEAIRSVFRFGGELIKRFLEFTDAGARFVFGPLVNHQTMEQVFGLNNGYIFIIRALPTVIFVSSVFTVLYHLRVLQLVVFLFAKVMMLIFGKKSISGAESLAATANVFMGQTEAPLIIKPFIAKMTQSELLALMIGGMATIAGGVMAVYIGMGADPVAILATSVMAAPTGLYLSKLLLPETEQPVTAGTVRLADERPHSNVFDAASSGASDGIFLVINITAMLIAFIAGIAMINALIGLLSPDWSLERIFPVCFNRLR
ncbi:MAG: Na+ dependent nucleoside transporter N-terminal domain-containing protein [Zavarzinella sp.]